MDPPGFGETNHVGPLEGWLAAGEKSGLPGKFKAWIDQHGILPGTLWPLLVYEFTLSTVCEGV